MKRFTILILGLLLAPPGAPLAPQERSPVLVRKWEYKIMERVYLSQPSGWINQMPWLISSPAIGDLGLGRGDLQVVTGTEEGFGEWFPRGDRSGRYICVSSAGTKLWEYETNNNAGRASPAIVDLKNSGKPVCTGGSTSGWMVHCFGADGARQWRYETANNSNVLAAPASGALSGGSEFETVAVSAEGCVYCLTSAGQPVWRARPAERQRRCYAAAAPAIADVDGDGRLEVIVTLSDGSSQRVYCLNGQTGATKWASDVLAEGVNTVASAPAILPRSDP